MKFCLAALLTLALGSHMAEGRDIFVATNAIPSGDFDSWTNAFTNVHEAFDYAEEGDTLHLAGHVFAFTSELQITNNNLTIFGGYVATNTTGLPGESDPERWPTTLTSDDSTHRIVHINGVTNVELSRLTVTGGEANLGGGIFVNTASNIFLSDMTVANNLSITNTGHHVSRGGGLYSLNSDLVVSNCLFTGNQGLRGQTYANVSGAGVDINGGTVTLVDSLIRGNTLDSNVTAGRSFGSGIRISSGTHVLRNLVISHNSMNGNNGNAIYSQSANVEVHNSTIVGHVGTAINADANLSVYNSILRWNGTDVDGVPDGNIHHTCLQTPHLTQQGNFNDDPLFERGLYLSSDSTCLGAGDRTVEAAHLAGYTTSTNGATYVGNVNLGYHHKTGLTLPDLYVNPSSGSDSNTGLNATSEALQTITEALRRAQAGTRINLASGDYTDTSETFPLVVDRHGVQIKGTNRTMTVIDATGSDQRVMNMIQTTGNRLEGLTLTGGRRNNQNAVGAGMYLQNVSDLYLIDCLWHDNRTTTLSSHYQVRSGGAIYADNVYATMQNCFVTNNSVYAGYQSYGQNQAEGNARGGGLFIAGGTWIIEQSVIADNWAESHFSNNSGSRGGGIYFDTGGSHILRNVVIARNACLRGGGSHGSYLGDGLYTRSPLTVNNLTLVDNGAGNPVEGQGIWMSAAVAMADSIVWGQDNDIVENTPGLLALSYSSIEDGDKDGFDGNVSIDPQFHDTDYYHLKSTHGVYTDGYFSGGVWDVSDSNSALIDAGHPASAAGREPQPNGGRVNMGAYGNTDVASRSAPLAIANLPATLVTTDSATLNAQIHSVGTSNVYVRFYWGVTDGGWTGDNVVGPFSAPGAVSLPVSDLTDSETYDFTAFASNAANETIWATPSASFFTGVSAPSIVTTGVDDEKTTSPILKGDLISTGGEPPEVYVCWGSEEGGSTTSSWQNVELVGTLGSGPFSHPIVTEFGSNYFYTVFAINSAGSSMGLPIPFGYYHIRYVSSGAIGSGTGYNWVDAFTSLSAALEQVSDSDNNIIHFRGVFPLVSQLTITNQNVHLLGGYAGDGAPGSRDPEMWPTILTNNASAIRLLSIQNTENVLVDGVEIVDGAVLSDGGGIWINGSTNVTIRNTVLRDNQTLAGHGGGGYVSASTNVVFENVTITGNKAQNGTTYGGGLYLLDSWGTISNAVFESNILGTSAADLGGGIMLAGGEWHLRDGRFFNNRAGHGGALYVLSGTHWINNQLLVQNRAVQGDGIYNSGTLTAYNLTLAGNLGEGIRHNAGSTTVRDSIFWKNRTDVVGSADVDDSLWNTDPLFEYGFYLADGSAAVNAGSRSVNDAGLDGYTTRAEGTPAAGTVDMGYHYISGKDSITADLYVVPGGTGTQTGENWDNALPSITVELDLATFGSHIHLANGEYVNAAETFPLILEHHAIRFIGSGRETTVIDATGADQRLINIDNIFGTRIENLTLTGGRSLENHATGGALHVQDSSDLRIENCRIQGNELPAFGSNYHTKRGGGIYAANTLGTLTDSLVVSNLANSGDTAYGHNIAEGTTRGGGLFLAGGQWAISRTVIADNEARVSFSANSGSRGGGIYAATGGNHTLRNVLIVGNRCTRAGGPGSYPGVYLGDGLYSLCPLTLENVTIADNGQGNPDSTQGVWSDALVTIENSIIWGHDADLMNFAVDGNGHLLNVGHTLFDGLPAMDGINGCMVGVDPLFEDTVYYHLQSEQGVYQGGYFDGGTWGESAATSPAIDAGDPNLPDSAWEAEPFPNGRLLNLGAYGGTPVASMTPTAFGTVFLFR